MTIPAGHYSMQTTAKLVGIGVHKLFDALRRERVLSRDNLPYQRYINAGYFVVHHGEWSHPTIGARHYGRTLVTVSGLRWIKDIINATSAGVEISTFSNKGKSSKPMEKPL